jgi:hypothetical protein
MKKRLNLFLLIADPGSHAALQTLPSGDSTA